MTTLQLLSDTPVFHGLAISFIEGEPEGSHLSQFLKLRMGDLRVGDPHAKEKPMLAITASKPVTAAEADIPTTTLPKLQPRLRNKSMDSTIVDWSPHATEG